VLSARRRLPTLLLIAAISTSCSTSGSTAVDPRPAASLKGVADGVSHRLGTLGLVEVHRDETMGSFGEVVPKPTAFVNLVFRRAPTTVTLFCGASPKLDRSEFEARVRNHAAAMKMGGMSRTPEGWLLAGARFDAPAGPFVRDLMGWYPSRSEACLLFRGTPSPPDPPAESLLRTASALTR
jgi:hypothetical protein